MNLQQIYSDAIGRKPKEEQEILTFSPAEDAAHKQGKLNWLQSTATSDMFKQIGEEIGHNLEQAVALACSYPTNGNHQLIIQLLVRANELQNILDKYSK